MAFIFSSELFLDKVGQNCSSKIIKDTFKHNFEIYELLLIKKILHS